MEAELSSRCFNIRSFLQKFGLDDYISAFEKYGYDSRNALLLMDTDDFRLCGLKPGHTKVLQAVISGFLVSISQTFATSSEAQPSLPSTCLHSPPASAEEQQGHERASQSGSHHIGSTHIHKYPESEMQAYATSTIDRVIQKEPESHHQGKHAEHVEKCRLKMLCDSMYEQLSILHSCLVEKGIVSCSEVSIKVHRKRWALVQRTSGWCAGACIDHVMQARELTSLIVQYIGTPALSMYRGTSRAIQAAIDDVSMKMYVCGGYSDGPARDVLNTIERFDPQRGVWESLPDMPICRSNFAAAVLDGRVYAFGTKGYLGAVVQRLECDGRTWSTLASMRQPRWDGTAAACDGCLYVCGGWIGGSIEKSASSVERLVLTATDAGAKGAWESIPPMAEGRASFQMVAIGGRLFVCGGQEAFVSFPKDSVECCCVCKVAGECTWNYLPPMLTARCYHGAAKVSSKLFVVAGLGKQGDVFLPLNSLESFDTASGTWTTMPSMPMPRTVLAATAIGNTLYVCGGFKEDWHPELESFPVGTMQKFDTLTGEWSDVASSMSLGRAGHVLLATPFEMLVS